MAKKFARAMSLSKEETEEFIALVDFTQAQEPLERNRYLKVLADLRVRQQLKSGEIKAETWEKVPSWVWVKRNRPGRKSTVGRLYGKLSTYPHSGRPSCGPA
ncbi:MAG: hypothetical protein HC902_10765, partial [Calothrix sp. SM1_5_4]|nr:hypothetical protein [Calothrix sp. SM1_5_4]